VPLLPTRLRALDARLWCVVVLQDYTARIAGKRKRTGLTEAAADQEAADAPANTEPAIRQGGSGQKASPLDRQRKGRRQKGQKVKQLADIYTAAAAPADEVAVVQRSDDEAACRAPVDEPSSEAAELPGEQPAVRSPSGGAAPNADGLGGTEAAPPKRRRCCCSDCCARPVSWTVLVSIR